MTEKTLIDLSIDYAMGWVGTPYIWGGDDFNGFDCSGFVQEILMGIGKDFPGDQTADALYRKMINHPEAMRAGSVAYFGSKKRITHCGYMISSVLMIEAGGGNSRSVDAKIAAKQNAYVRMRPVFNRKDFVCAKFIHHEL